MLQTAIIARKGRIRADVKGARLSLTLYIVAIPLAFISVLISVAIYIVVAPNRLVVRARSY